MIQHLLHGEEATLAFGASLAKDLRAGDLVLLKGDLGAGKTTLVRGILSGIGYDGPVRSPTFTLMQVYETDPPILHADLYRINPGAGVESVGLEEYLDSHLCLIEWPDRLPDWILGLPHRSIELNVQGDSRLLRLNSPHA